MQMRTLEESQLSAEQREELYSLRHIKEPGELMVPPESSLDNYEGVMGPSPPAHHTEAALK